MLKFIGTGSASNSEMGNTSAYILENGTLLLIDCGSTVFSRIKEINLLDEVKKVYVIITHTHNDHIGSLATLIEYLYYFKNIVTNIVLTNSENSEIQENTLHSYLTLSGVAEDFYEFVYGDMMEDVFENLVKIEMPEIKHSKMLTSHAVEIYFKDFIIYYTGDHKDMSYAKKVAKKLKENDFVYTDCTLIDNTKIPHIALNSLEEIFPEEQRKQVCCMHFENYNTYSEAKQSGFRVANRELSKQEILKSIANRK